MDTQRIRNVCVGEGTITKELMLRAVYVFVGGVGGPQEQSHHRTTTQFPPSVATNGLCRSTIQVAAEIKVSRGVVGINPAGFGRFHVILLLRSGRNGLEHVLFRLVQAFSLTFVPSRITRMRDECAYIRCVI